MKRAQCSISLLFLALLFGISRTAQAQHPATLWLEYNFDATNFNPAAGVYVVNIYGAWQDAISGPTALINLSFPPGYFDAADITISGNTAGGWIAYDPVYAFYGTYSVSSYAAVQFPVVSDGQKPTPRQLLATVTFRMKPNSYLAIIGYYNAFDLSTQTAPAPPTGDNQTGLEYIEADGTFWSGLSFNQPTTLNTSVVYPPPAIPRPALLVVPGGPVDAPYLTKLSRYTAAAGDPGFTLSVFSDNFYAGYVVEWNGSPRPTTRISQTQFDAQISAADIAKPGTNYIHVRYYYLGTDFTMNLPFVVQTSHISGKVALEGGAVPASPLTFTLTSPRYGQTFVTATPAADGSFDLGGQIPDAYALSVKNFNSLRMKAAADNTNGAVSGLALFLPGGDANNDNSVDSSDFGILIGAFNTQAGDPGGGYNPNADFNGDGWVDSTDFGILIGNYGQIGADP